MSLLFCDGFDHLGSSDFTLKWDGTSGSCSIDSTGGRNGKSCFSGSQATLVKNIGSSVTEIIMAGAFKFSSNGTGAHFMILQNSGSNTRVTGLQWATDNTIKLDQPDNNNFTYATSSITLTPGNWYYIEWKMTIGTSIAANSCVVRVNGAEVINLAAGTNTTYVASTVDQAIYGSISGAINSFGVAVDDVVLLDLNGTKNNDFLGDVTIEAIYPNGAGNYSNFGNNGAGTGYGCVNDHPNDGDSTYVSSSNPGDRESFAFGSLSETPESIKAIQVVSTARKQGSGSRTAASFLRIAATNYDGTAYALGDSYAIFHEIHEQNPNTSADWTQSDIDALEAGTKLVS